MIKNVIFDMGAVLIEWNPQLFLKRYGLTDQKDIDAVLANTVGKKHWHQYDLGILTLDELETKCLKTMPKHLYKPAIFLIRHWPEQSKTIEGMVEYIKYLKKKGYKLYMLTNAGKNQSYYIRKYPYMKYFDGKCVSAHYGCGKPDKEFFEALLKKYKLKKEECVFIDDTQKNVDGANSIGIKAYRFENVTKLKKDLQL